MLFFLIFNFKFFDFFQFSFYLNLICYIVLKLNFFAVFFVKAVAAPFYSMKFQIIFSFSLQFKHYRNAPLLNLAFLVFQFTNGKIFFLLTTKTVKTRNTHTERRT